LLEEMSERDDVWLPFEAYLSLETLEEKLTEVLLNIGTKFIISFA